MRVVRFIRNQIILTAVVCAAGYVAYQVLLDDEAKEGIRSLTRTMSDSYGQLTNMVNERIGMVMDDGTEATLAEGALWLMAWGVAHPVMTSQLAWNPGSAYCMAEVEPKVFQMTGVAVEETDGTTVGGRFRYDYISMKYFHQDGWGGEMGTVTFTEEAAKYLAQPGNIELASGVKLTKGATYRLTIDLNDGEKVDFREVK